jgi:hypothetical protein
MCHDRLDSHRPLLSGQPTDPSLVWRVVALLVTHRLSLAMERPLCDKAFVLAMLPTCSYHEIPSGSSGKPQGEAPLSRFGMRSAMLTLIASNAVKEMTQHTILRVSSTF